MKRSWDRHNFIAWFVMGFLFAFTLVFAPIHEFGHWFLSQDAHIIAWNKTANVDRTLTAIMGGITTEFLFFMLIQVICGIYASKYNKRWLQSIVGFCFGYMHGVTISGCFEHDLTVSLVTLGYNYNTILWSWFLMNVPFLLIFWGFWLYYLKKG